MRFCSDGVEKVANLEDVNRVINFSFKNVVLVGSADVMLSDHDRRLLSEMEKPLFVYFNHASLSDELQGTYPKVYGEALFIRGGGGGVLGVDSCGAAWFSPKEEKNFFGAFVLNPPKDYTISNLTHVYQVSKILYQQVQEEYPANEEGRRSPTTGYFAEYVLRGLSDMRLASGEFFSGISFYTIGFGLGAGFGKAVQHNLLHEQKLQREKFGDGRLKPLGVISKPRVPISKRKRPKNL